MIGFAETATGVASAVCHYLNNVIYYQNTTRENIPQKDYLYFTESHSHATDQMLISEGIGNHIKNVDRIVFVDDEVTTGNTICKLIKVLKNHYDVDNAKFTIVSILNSMGSKRRDELKTEGVECIFLAELPFEYKKDSIQDVLYESQRDVSVHTNNVYEVEEIVFKTNVNVRLITSYNEYENAIKLFISLIKRKIASKHYNHVLLWGTEECMYPAICVGAMLKDNGFADEVKMHATTRSPIIASGSIGYPLQSRFHIRSMYDENRDTYVYNLSKYEEVIIVTDTSEITPGINDLVQALRITGNENIILAHWLYT